MQGGSSSSDTGDVPKKKGNGNPFGNEDELPRLHRRLIRLACLMEGSNNCAAVCILNGKIYFGANDFDNKLGERWGRKVARIQEITAVMKHFKKYSKGHLTDSEKMRKSRDRLVDSVSKAQSSRYKDRSLKGKEEKLEKTVKTMLKIEESIKGIDSKEKDFSLKYASAFAEYGYDKSKKDKESEGNMVLLPKPTEALEKSASSDEQKKTTIEIHAEMQILDLILRNADKLSGQEIFIGISRKCCLDCHATLLAAIEILKQDGIIVKYGYAHNKNFSKGWGIPPFLMPDSDRYLSEIDTLREEMREKIRANRENEKRFQVNEKNQLYAPSDSDPTSREYPIELDRQKKRLRQKHQEEQEQEQKHQNKRKRQRKQNRPDDSEHQKEMMRLIERLRQKKLMRKQGEPVEQEAPPERQDNDDEAPRIRPSSKKLKRLPSDEENETPPAKDSSEKEKKEKTRIVIELSSSDEEPKISLNKASGKKGKTGPFASRSLFDSQGSGKRKRNSNSNQQVSNDQESESLSFSSNISTGEKKFRKKTKTIVSDEESEVTNDKDKEKKPLFPSSNKKQNVGNLKTASNKAVQVKSFSHGRKFTATKNKPLPPSKETPSRESSFGKESITLSDSKSTASKAVLNESSHRVPPFFLGVPSFLSVIKNKTKRTQNDEKKEAEVTSNDEKEDTKETQNDKGEKKNNGKKPLHPK